MHSILFATNDVMLRRTMARQWEGQGFLVAQTGQASEAASLATGTDRRFDAIVLDVELAGGNGRDLCARLRRHGLRTPVMLLGASQDEDEVVDGLDAGANDYVAKPCRHAELTARLRAQIRAHESSEDAVLRIGPYDFKPGTKMLIDPDSERQVRLTEKECRVLKYLYRAGGKAVSRRTLLHEVWGYADGADTHTVETHIYRLRRKLEPTAESPRVLINQDGGYCLNVASHSRRGWTRAAPVELAMAG